MNIKIILILFNLITLNLICNVSNNQIWDTTREQYKDLCVNIKQDFLNIKNDNYCSNYWNLHRKKLENLIFQNLPQSLWQEQFLHQNMIRGGIDISQEYEICYIKNCLSLEVKDLLLSYKDVELNGIPLECKEFNCSTNTLGHLYYSAKILETAKNNNLTIKNIVEFGAGYGNLARILKMLLTQSTIVLIDLPEFLALQCYFLKTTLPNNIEIFFHANRPSKLKNNAIHLIPVFFMNDLDFNCDLFISTFALSEVPYFTQSIVKNKNFFNANISYITGQLDGGTEIKMEDHDVIHEAIRNCYSHVICQPFHNLFQALKSYEIIGIKK